MKLDVMNTTHFLFICWGNDVYKTRLSNVWEFAKEKQKFYRSQYKLSVFAARLSCTIFGKVA